MLQKVIHRLLSFASLHVTISIRNLVSFYHLLESNEDYGRLVKIATFSLYQDKMDDETYETTMWELRSMSTSSSTLDSESRIRNIIECVYQRLTQVQIPVISDLALRFSFQARGLNGKMAPLPFLSTSLKKLCIPNFDLDKKTPDSPGKDLSGTALTWLLRSCQSLEEVCVPVLISTADFDLLSELSDALQGISKVKKLALQIIYASHSTDRRTWWGTPRELAQSWNGGSKKTQALILLLKITKGLTALEASYYSETSNREDQTSSYSSCISTLRRSFDTLKHLRLCALLPDPTNPASTDYSLFQSLRIISVEAFSLS